MCRHRGLRAHAAPGADRLLRDSWLLLGRERLDAVRAGLRGPARRAARDRLLPRAARAGRGRLPRLALRARARPGRVRLRLELRLLPARLPPAGAGDDRLPAARRALRGPSVAGPSRARRVILDGRLPTCTDTDKAHLERAIELAGNGSGRSSPTRSWARSWRATARSWARAGTRSSAALHAEVNAIEACGLEDLSGATLYVSLEPCCHEGKTPPCTEAILQAGIRRVVVASDDPTEKASGRGLGILRDEGVEVVLADGELAASARLLNQAFRKHARVGRPWVLFKSAMTLDGKVATRTGDSQVDQRRGQPRAGPPLARVGRRGRRRYRHGARRRPAADGASGRPARRARRPAASRRVRLARAPAAHLPARRRRRGDPAHGRRLAGGRARGHRRAGSGRRAGARGHRRKRARARALGARAAGRARRRLGAARGRPAPRRRVPRCRRDRRDPAVPRAAAARRERGPRSAGGRRASSRSPRRCARSPSTARASARTC